MLTEESIFHCREAIEMQWLMAISIWLVRFGWCGPFFGFLIANSPNRNDRMRMRTRTQPFAAVHRNSWFVLHHIIGCKRFEWEKKKRVYTFKFGSIKSNANRSANKRSLRACFGTSSNAKFPMVAVLLFVYWMGQDPLEIHTLHHRAHNLDGEEKDTHISSQQLFSWVINRVRCARELANRTNERANTTCRHSESERWQWSIGVAMNKTKMGASDRTNKKVWISFSGVIQFKLNADPRLIRPTISYTNFRHFP